MVSVLQKEQTNDEKQKSWCAGELEKSADEESAAKSKSDALDATIEETTDEIQATSDEIESLGNEIKALDKAVAEATEQRKEEHAGYLETMTLNEAAISLIGKAKSRLAKFYQPPALVQTDDAAADQAPMPADQVPMFAQISMHSDAELDSELGTELQTEESNDGTQAQAQATGTFGQYKKSEKAGGVMGLMDMLVHEMEMANKDAEYEEKTAQKDYTELMSDSQTSRAQDMKSITDKGVAKADLEGRLQTANEDKASATDELMGIKEMIQNLHKSCDFIIQNFDIRKEARGNEIESLKNAKAVLSGADFR